MTEYRDAVESDLPGIVMLLADDPLGSTREDPSVPLGVGYLDAFRSIGSMPGQRLVVAVDDGRLIGTMQLVVIPGLSSRGSRHGQIEAVRIVSDRRGGGDGSAFVRWAVAELRSAGCATVQLLSHSSRSDAHRFWIRQGFQATHRGFKMTIPGD